jgi:hypothetical protein
MLTDKKQQNQRYQEQGGQQGFSSRLCPQGFFKYQFSFEAFRPHIDLIHIAKQKPEKFSGVRHSRKADSPPAKPH